jgi:hypothetical protein
VPIDASQVIWIATANDERTIPDPILNRMNVYEVQAPDHDAARAIARRLYDEIRGDHDWGQRFAPAPRDDVLDRLAELPPREMRRAWMTGFGNARLAGRDEVRPTTCRPSGRAGRASASRTRRVARPWRGAPAAPPPARVHAAAPYACAPEQDARDGERRHRQPHQRHQHAPAHAEDAPECRGNIACMKMSPALPSPGTSACAMAPVRASR